MRHSIFRPAGQGMLAISLMLLVFPASYADNDRPTDRQCLDAYMTSPAVASCESGVGDAGETNIFVNYENLCAIADTCPTSEGSPRRSNIKVTVEQASDVENCDGVLKLSC